MKSMFAFLKTYIKRGLKIANKIFIVLAVYFIAIGLLAHFFNQDKPKATYDPIQENRTEIYKTINDPQLNKTKEGKFFIASFRLMTCGLIGEACTNKQSDGNRNYHKSFIGQATNLMMVPFVNPPASGVMWVYSGLQKAGFIPKTYAAGGIGFYSIQPLAKVWATLRDVAYIILVLILITFGFMIMFRVKINPQTVISMENSIPRIVIALLMITFSFAIAGFLIDFMYIMIILVVALLGQAGGLDVPGLQARYVEAGPGEIFNSLISRNPWNIFWDLPNHLINFVPLIGVLFRIAGSLIGAVIVVPWLTRFGIVQKILDLTKTDSEGVLTPLGVGFSAIFKLFSNLQDIPGLIIAMLIAAPLTAYFILPLAVGLLLMIGIIFIFFRIFFLLFSAYIKTILMIILAPLYLLLDVFPGRSAFSGWIRSVAVELITFPATIAIFMLSQVVLNTVAGQGGSSIFTRFPFMYGVNPTGFAFVISLWFLYVTPDLVNGIRKAFAPKPGPFEGVPGFGAFFGGVAAGAGATTEQLSRYASLAFYGRSLPFIGKLFKKRGVRAGEDREEE